MYSFGVTIFKIQNSALCNCNEIFWGYYSTHALIFDICNDFNETMVDTLHFTAVSLQNASTY